MIYTQIMYGAHLREGCFFAILYQRPILYGCNKMCRKMNLVIVELTSSKVIGAILLLLISFLLFYSLTP